MGPTTQRRFTRGLGSGLVVVALVTSVYPGEKESGAGANGRSSKAKAAAKANDASDATQKKTTETLSEGAPVADIAGLAASASNGSIDRSPAGRLLAGEAALADTEEMDFAATAYSLSGTTASGQPARKGMIAADPRVLPLGTLVQITAGSYSGTYRVLDTGGRIRGHKIDIFVPTRREALGFGRRSVRLKVLGRPSSIGAKAIIKENRAAAANQN